ncbi:hypothetical protein [Burkholderia gladioli]|uniref:hypothetical protein n=1 Tax=Burkholderia gladioli TaxID=28095 RepID=UPI00163F1755|nr:hypothetical protein [Burkholderia gladioli]
MNAINFKFTESIKMHNQINLFADRIRRTCNMSVILGLFAAGATGPALASDSTSEFRFTLPNGASIVYSKASYPQAALEGRAWQHAVFHLANGVTFSLLPRAGESEQSDSIMEPPSASLIAPSGRYVVVGRIETGSLSTGPDQPSTSLSREYCSAIEIKTGCITADQTGEICGVGWRAKQPEQWGSDFQTSQMLKDDCPSARDTQHDIDAGQPVRLLMRENFGADNLLRCDPPVPENREAYQKISAALHASGEQFAAHLIDTALSKTNATSVSPVNSNKGSAAANISAARATLYSAPKEASATRAYLIKNDKVTILQQSLIGWAYVDYVNASGKHLLRWIKAEDVAITP